MWERIEELMKERNLKISDVAKGSGVSYSTLTDWKSGRYVPKRDKIEKLANFFEVLPDYIEGKTDRKEKIKVEVKRRTSDTPRESISEIVENISELVYQQFLREHPEYDTENTEEKSGPDITGYDKETVERAMTFLSQYEQASPEVRRAIDALLAASRPQP